MARRPHDPLDQLLQDQQADQQPELLQLQDRTANKWFWNDELTESNNDLNF